jgi:hypothetical protein
LQGTAADEHRVEDDDGEHEKAPPHLRMVVIAYGTDKLVDATPSMTTCRLC